VVLTLVALWQARPAAPAMAAVMPEFETRRFRSRMFRVAAQVAPADRAAVRDRTALR
jgi:hypothetical protein